MGLSGRGLFSPPGALGTAGLNRFSPQSSPRRVELSHFRPPVQISPQVPLGLAGSVFSVTQVPWGLPRRNSSRLPGTFGTGGTRSFQPTKYAVDNRDSVTSAPPVFWALAGVSHSKPHGHSGSKYRSDSRDSISSAPQVPRKRLDSIVSAPRHPRDGWDSVISGPRVISAPRNPWDWRDQYFQLPQHPGDERDATIPGSRVPSVLAGLGHFSPPSTLWTNRDSVTSVPPVFWALAGVSHSKPHGHSGSDTRDSISSAPQVPRKRLDSIVSARRHPRDGWDSLISGPWVILAPRYPWDSRDQYFQLPKYPGD